MYQLTVEEYDISSNSAVKDENPDPPDKQEISGFLTFIPNRPVKAVLTILIMHGISRHSDSTDCP